MVEVASSNLAGPTKLLGSVFPQFDFSLLLRTRVWWRFTLYPAKAASEEHYPVAPP